MSNLSYYGDWWDRGKIQDELDQNYKKNDIKINKAFFLERKTKFNPYCNVDAMVATRLNINTGRNMYGFNNIANYMFAHNGLYPMDNGIYNNSNNGSHS